MSKQDVIEVEGITIEPLWVEAYYFHKNVFSDCNTHLSEKQKNRFGQLYFHEKGRGGFDLCLSDSEDYYLSFLLKRTSINGKFVKQADAEDVLEKNGKTIYDRKDLINTMPCILFCHDDMDFVTGDPGRKRFFIDQSLSLYDILYIDVIRKYRQILKSRNLLLKEQKYEMLDVYDIQLAAAGIQIQKKRKTAIFKFNEIFTKLYFDITGIENVRIFYEPSWKEIDEGISKRTPDENEILNILKNKREIDKIMNTTMSGPHRDKIKFVKDGMLFVPVASTGQRRLIALLLRISQAVFFNQITKENPILLMDDVMLELDPDKRQKLTSMLPEYDQLFCTFLPGEPYERYRRSSTKIINVKDGAWYE